MIQLHQTWAWLQVPSVTLPNLSSLALFIQGQLSVIYSGPLNSRGQKAPSDPNLT